LSGTRFISFTSASQGARNLAGQSVTTPAGTAASVLIAAVAVVVGSITGTVALLIGLGIAVVGTLWSPFTINFISGTARHYNVTAQLDTGATNVRGASEMSGRARINGVYQNYSIFEGRYPSFISRRSTPVAAEAFTSFITSPFQVIW